MQKTVFRGCYKSTGRVRALSGSDYDVQLRIQNILLSRLQDYKAHGPNYRLIDCNDLKIEPVKRFSWIRTHLGK